MYLIREYINEDKTEILDSDKWVEVPEVPMSDRHENMGYHDDMSYWTVRRCRDMEGGWLWDCADIVPDTKPCSIVCPECNLSDKVERLDEYHGYRCDRCSIFLGV